MLVSTEKMLADARRNHYAIPAPDFWDSRSVSAFVKTAESLNAPLILSFAQIHLSYLSLAESEGGRAPSPWPDILKGSGDAAETVLRRYYKVFHLA